MPNDENCSQRRFQVSSLAVRSGPWIQRSGMTAAQETAVNPRSETTLRAAARLSVLRNPSSMLSVSSTFLMPAFAQPSSDLRYPAAREVFWCRQSVILGVAAWTGTTTCASGASSAVLRESMRPNIPKSCPSRDLPPGRFFLKRENPMLSRVAVLSLPLCLSLCLFAADEQGWKDKQVPDWTDEDAKQVLADSPWVKTVTATIGQAQPRQ